MKSIKLQLKLFLIFLLSIHFISCSKKSNPADTNLNNQDSALQYYPGNGGSKFNYAVETVTQAGISFMGSRMVSFTGLQKVNNTEYFVQLNSTKLRLDTVKTNAFFRRTNAGVYFFLDTTGVYKYYQATPGSSASMDFDRELIVYSRYLDQSASWKVYKIGLNFTDLASYNIIDLIANYLVREDISLNLTSGQVTMSAEKIKYTLNLRIPDKNDPGKFSFSSFAAFMWFVKDIGIVKLQGNMAVIEVLTGSSTNLSDTSQTMTQNLISYEIK
ncbi:MAG: hypothetical protein NTX22_15320 [Ignavibacteriales bacterium]|nr:hypothetical protein [Ignavibacteriales bacterium]